MNLTHLIMMKFWAGASPVAAAAFVASTGLAADSVDRLLTADISKRLLVADPINRLLEAEEI